MSMAWMPMCGRTWLDAAMSFLGMWVAMMVAMMLPSLMPTLWRYGRAVGATGAHLYWLTALVGVGYFLVWSICGLCIYPLCVALSAVELQLPVLARIGPIATGWVVLIAGALQFTAWKARLLACCRPTPAHCVSLRAEPGAALGHGLRLGLHCACCCVGPTASLLALGIMDLRAMAVTTAAITAERLAPGGEHVARATGAVAVGIGLLLTGRAAGL
jgi:predicted metal-binding membrane protein